VNLAKRSISELGREEPGRATPPFPKLEQRSDDSMMALRKARADFSPSMCA
jgi:hypothetical protein